MRAERTHAGRRWRRLLRAIPAAVTVWGMLWAASAGAFQPPTKSGRKADARDDEPRFEFAMSGQPWSTVFAWLSEKSGNLPIVGVAVPTGTFTLIGPNKKYTMGEVIDLINAGLLSN